MDRNWYTRLGIIIAVALGTLWMLVPTYYSFFVLDRADRVPDGVQCHLVAPLHQLRQVGAQIGQQGHFVSSLLLCSEARGSRNVKVKQLPGHRAELRILGHSENCVASGFAELVESQ